MRDSRRGRSIAARSAVVVLALVFAAPGSSAIREDPGPPESGTAAPGAVGHHCETGPYAKPPKIRSDPSSPVKQSNLCGSNQADEFWTNGEDWVWGLGGNDVIHAKNGVPDVIYGGAGNDRAFIDGKGTDTTISVEKCRLPGRKTWTRCPKATTKNLRLAAPSFFAPADYPSWPATVECYRASDGSVVIRYPEEAAMRAVDSTSIVDWQTVATSDLLYKWDGTQWRLFGQSAWRWDRTYDLQWVPFVGNAWRTFDTGSRVFIHWELHESGKFRAAIHLHWYATPYVPAYDTLVWAGRHYGDFDDGTHQACDIPPA
jgi:hypothetical protein